jgi:hypothetical protein
MVWLPVAEFLSQKSSVPQVAQIVSQALMSNKKEIVTKLRQVNVLMAQGKTQADATCTIGVTYVTSTMSAV